MMSRRFLPVRQQPGPVTVRNPGRFAHPTQTSPLAVIPAHPGIQTFSLRRADEPQALSAMTTQHLLDDFRQMAGYASLTRPTMGSSFQRKLESRVGAIPSPATNKRLPSWIPACAGMINQTGAVRRVCKPCLRTCASGRLHRNPMPMVRKPKRFAHPTLTSPLSVIPGQAGIQTFSLRRADEPRALSAMTIQHLLNDLAHLAGYAALTRPTPCLSFQRRLESSFISVSLAQFKCVVSLFSNNQAGCLQPAGSYITTISSGSTSSCRTISTQPTVFKSSFNRITISRTRHDSCSQLFTGTDGTPASLHEVER